MSGWEDWVILCGAILCQAVADYKEVLKCGGSFSHSGSDGFYSTEELCEFFDGEWCDFLLNDVMEFGLPGRNIPGILKSNYINQST